MVSMSPEHSSSGACPGYSKPAYFHVDQGAVDRALKTTSLWEIVGPALLMIAGHGGRMNLAELQDSLREHGKLFGRPFVVSDKAKVEDFDFVEALEYMIVTDLAVITENDRTSITNVEARHLSFNDITIGISSRFPALPPSVSDLGAWI